MPTENRKPIPAWVYAQAVIRGMHFIFRSKDPVYEDKVNANGAVYDRSAASDLERVIQVIIQPVTGWTYSPDLTKAEQEAKANLPNRILDIQDEADRADEIIRYAKTQVAPALWMAGNLRRIGKVRPEAWKEAAASIRNMTDLHGGTDQSRFNAKGELDFPTERKAAERFFQRLGIAWNRNEGCDPSAPGWKAWVNELSAETLANPRLQGQRATRDQERDAMRNMGSRRRTAAPTLEEEEGSSASASASTAAPAAAVDRSRLEMLLEMADSGDLAPDRVANAIRKHVLK